MKVKFFLWFLLLIGAYACSDDEDIEAVEFFEPLSVDTLWYGQTETFQYIALEASMQINVEVGAEAVAWCRAEITGTGKGQMLAVHCGTNEEVDMRYTTLSLKTNQIERKLVICQYGVAPVIKVITSTFELSEDTTVLKVPVVSNVKYEVIPNEAWVHSLGIIKGNNMDTLRLGISPSIYPRRSQDILLKWKDLAATITIYQISSDTIYHPQNDFILNKIKVVNGSANYEGRGNGFKYSYDGTKDRYVSGWVPLDQEVIMTWNFERAEQLSEMTYYPAEIDLNRCFGVFHLYVKEEGSNDFKDLGEQDFGYKLIPSTYFFDRNLKKIEAVQVKVAAPAGSQGNWVLSCQEMEFYAPGFDVKSIFVDEICSDLKEGVTYDQIMSIEDEFYRNIARYMYMGTYDKRYRIQEYQPYMNPDVQGSEHKAMKWSFLDNPTGIRVNAGDQVVLLVGEIGDERLKVQIVDWHTINHNNFYPNESAFLKPGINIFTADKSGLLYILYNSDNITGKEPVKIHIPSGEVNGYFDIAQHDNAYWKSLLNKAGYKFLDVKGKLAHLLFPVEDFRQYCPDNIERLLEVYDSVMLLEHQLSGLYKYNRMYPNRILCKVAYDDDFSYLMYASDYHTGYSVASVPGILTAETLRKEIWGVAHEIGHVHQNRNITWPGMTEVSNNVFSLYVQTTFGNTSRLLNENLYERAYQLLAVTGISYNKPDVFIKLVPLWQLYLYFSKVLDNPEFYMDLYEEMRNEDSPASPQMNFIELCCRIGHVDLRDFFRFYGFLVTVDVGEMSGIVIRQEDIDRTLQNIEAMQLTVKAPAIQYLRDDNVVLFRNVKPVEKGEVSLSGSILTLSGWKNVVAYEVYEEENLIQVSTKNNFTLSSIGSNIHIRAISADGSWVKVELP